MASIGGAGTFDGIFLIGIVAVLIASLSQSMEQKLTSDARPIPDHVVDGLVRFDHGDLLKEEDGREIIRRIRSACCARDGAARLPRRQAA